MYDKKLEHAIRAYEILLGIGYRGPNVRGSARTQRVYHNLPGYSREPTIQEILDGKTGFFMKINSETGEIVYEDTVDYTKKELSKLFNVLNQIVKSKIKE